MSLGREFWSVGVIEGLEDFLIGRVRRRGSALDEV